MNNAVCMPRQSGIGPVSGEGGPDQDYGAEGERWSIEEQTLCLGTCVATGSGWVRGKEEERRRELIRGDACACELGSPWFTWVDSESR